jgi:hypothetical protein
MAVLDTEIIINHPPHHPQKLEFEKTEKVIEKRASR